MASSASTPPVIEIGAKGGLGRKLCARDHDLIDLGRELRNRRRKNQTPHMAPEDGAHTHRTGLAGGVKRAAAQRCASVIGETAPDRHHLPVRRRIAGRAPQVAAARDHRAIAHNHCAKGKISLAGFIDGHAHETQVVGRRIAGLRARADQRDGGTRKPGEERTSA
jgi:hypothetical protein